MLHIVVISIDIAALSAAAGLLISPLVSLIVPIICHTFVNISVSTASPVSGSTPPNIVVITRIKIGATKQHPAIM